MSLRWSSLRWSLLPGAVELTPILLLLSGFAQAQEPLQSPAEPLPVIPLKPEPQEQIPQEEPAPQPGLPLPGTPIPAPTEEKSAPPRSDTGRVDCYTDANALVSLTEEDALRLCDAAESDAPVQCYQLARNEGMLDEHQAVLLCRYATSVGPAECFLAAKARTFLAENEIVRLCQPFFLDVWGWTPSPYN